MTGPIDLDENVPSTDLLYERLTLVTAASEHHHREMLGFIGSAQRVMPDRPIVVYDLGLENDTREMIASLCNVRVRTFPFESYPSHVRTLGKFGWKAVVVTEALNDFGIIYYGDSSVRFHRPVKDLISNGLEHHGFVPHIRCFNPKLTVNDPWGCKHDYQVTVKEVYPILGVDEEEYYNANFSAPAVSATLMFVINNTFIQANILKPWLECSLNEDCVAPKKSSRKNHRFDQSALTLLFFKNMRGEWTVENNPTPYHLAFMSIQRGSDGYQWHPQTCKGNVDG
ncbi:hypothetical protein HOLleu_04212 [Holothuria leucospilota]|uniref:Uncharacterized protein n=1 Tax=Holothuria leucospilota TaxID=206669 RepID=A0A9Q1CSZ3_HOLLE|nr:hypothetical protein HOLleu_04212 [Holothuria leucospilota]